MKKLAISFFILFIFLCFCFVYFLCRKIEEKEIKCPELDHYIINIDINLLKIFYFFVC